MSSKQWYEQYQEKLQAEQSTQSRTEIAETLQKSGNHVFDPETAPKQEHVWIDRGEKYTCENANHHWHEIWKRRPIAQA